MSGEKPVIYLIDDHKSFTYLTKHVVNHYHNSICEIFEFSNAETALNEIFKDPGKPDYIFLDLAMPEMDGWSLIDKLENKLKTDNFPFEIIIITGSENMKDYQNALSKDCVSHYIPKPLNLAKIKQIFESDKFLRSFRKSRVN